MSIIPLQEHDFLSGEHNAAYEKLHLVRWDKPLDKCWGYYASYVIGAEWVDKERALVVTTKRGMESIDFLGMFMTCVTSNLEVESFSKIYSIDFDSPAIYSPALKNVLSPLIVLHFLGVVGRIKVLKKGYVGKSENLKKVKGHISVSKNERTNIAVRRFDRVFCDYDNYSVDIPENRLIKKALLFCKAIVNSLPSNSVDGSNVRTMLSRSLSLFENVSDTVQIREVTQIKGHKLYCEYKEAIRLAKLILRQYDYSIHKANNSDGFVTPFTLDMALLYEHYVYGLLNKAYGGKITYQFKGETGYPDFLFRTDEFKAILDTKYIPKYESQSLDTAVIRQISGYSRDIPVLKQLGYDDIKEYSCVPDVPCVIIYPVEGKGNANPFMEKELKELISMPVPNLSRFYKICVPLPIV